MNSAPTPLRVVAAVLVRPDSKILFAQRPLGKAFAGYWELPGGKVEPDEMPEQALCRELEEELGIVCVPTSLTFWRCVEHLYPHAFVNLSIYICRTWEGEARAKEGQVLSWQNPIVCSPILPATLPLIDDLMRAV